MLGLSSPLGHLYCTLLNDVCYCINFPAPLCMMHAQLPAMAWRLPTQETHAQARGCSAGSCEADMHRILPV